LVDQTYRDKDRVWSIPRLFIVGKGLGRHRRMRALLEDKKTIKAVRFDKTPYQCYTDKEANNDEQV
jgi:hypothetical protein